MENKALVGQIHGAFFAVEAVVVPGLSFIGHHTGAFTKPCGGNRSRQERQLSGHRWQPGCRLAHSWSRQARRLHPPGAHPPLHRALSPTPPGPEKMPELRRGPPALQNPHPQPPPSPCDWRAPTSQHNQFLWFRSGPWHQSGHQEANLGCLWGVHLPGLEELLSFDFFL